VFILSACGGSGSSTTSASQTSYPFELTATLNNSCGGQAAFSDIELLLQDDDWQVIERYQADASGVISFTTSDEYINYTLVAGSQQGDEAAGLDIKSFYQANSAVTSSYQATYDSQISDASCECFSNNVVLTHRTLASMRDVHSSLPYDAVVAIDSNTTQFINVQACREVGGSWPVASFMVSGDSLSGQLVGAANFLTSFEESDGWELAAIEIPEEVSLVANETLSFNSAQLFSDAEHFSMVVAAADQSLLIFNSHEYISEAQYKFYAQKTLGSSSTLFSESSLNSTQQILSSSFDGAYSAEVEVTDVDIDYINFSELSADGSFDYSSVNNHPMAIIAFSYSVLDDEGQYYPVTWTTYHEDQGSLASSVPLPDYPDIVNQTTTIIDATQVTLVRSDSSSRYQDYISFFQQGKGIATTEVADGDFNDDIHFYQANHQLR